MYNKMLMLLLLFSLFFPGIRFFEEDKWMRGSKLASKSNRFMVLITVVILYICSIAVKLFYDQLDFNTSDMEYIHSANHGRTFPTSWPINWQPYPNRVPDVLENDRTRSRTTNERRQTRRQRLLSRRTTDVQEVLDVLEGQNSRRRNDTALESV